MNAMSKINPKLLARLESKLGISRRRVYALIADKVNTTHLNRSTAAIALASERGLNISQFATHDQLSEIRQSSGNVNSVSSITSVPHSAQREVKSKAKPSPKGRSNMAPQKAVKNSVWVVHGRDAEARKAIFVFLRSIGLNPLEFSQALADTRSGSPYIGQVLDTAFKKAVAVVVLLTPDDEARLKHRLRTSSDGITERNLTGQARPNVLFEAGMAFGLRERSTILVQLGDIRPFSDVGGRHVLHLDNTSQKRQDFAERLKAAGCKVNISGTDWHDAGNFEPRYLKQKTKAKSRKHAKRP